MYSNTSAAPPRPGHLHVIVKIGGVRRLTTQLYFDDELDTFIAEDVIHGLTVSGPDANIEPNLLHVQETLDRDGNLVQTVHKDLVIDEPSTADPVFSPKISNLQRNGQLVSMSITPGRLVDIQVSHDLLAWTTLASNQSAVFGELVPSASPRRFYRLSYPD